MHHLISHNVIKSLSHTLLLPIFFQLSSTPLRPKKPNRSHTDTPIMTHCFKFFALFLVAVALSAGRASVHAQEEKCGTCTTPSPPPPSPPPPSPPPPSPCPPPPALPPPTPVLPPPSPKKPPTSYCPPPPSGGLFYITGPPGQLYPIDQDFNGANGARSWVGLPVLLGLGVLGVLAFW